MHVEVDAPGGTTMKQEQAGTDRDKSVKLTRRDFLGIAGLLTATLGARAGLAWAPIHAQANPNDEPLPANIWTHLGELMLEATEPDAPFYGLCGYSPDTALPGHPVGCPCCT